jgi:hypothetical protein
MSTMILGQSLSTFSIDVFYLLFCQGIPEEELLRQQQALFAQARMEQAQVIDLFIISCVVLDGILYIHEMRCSSYSASSCWSEKSLFVSRLSKNSFSRLKWHKHQIQQTFFLPP